MLQPAPGQDRPGITEFLFNNCFKTKQSLGVDDIPLQVVFFIAHGQDLVHVLIAKPLQQWSQSVHSVIKSCFFFQIECTPKEKGRVFLSCQASQVFLGILKTSSLILLSFSLIC